MNQILITKKLYITPELKRNKKLYKSYFIISCIFVVILVILAIYDEYKRNESEAVSREILQNMELTNNSVIENDDAIMVILNNENPSSQFYETVIKKPEDNKKYELDIGGYHATAIAEIHIPKINVNYPILRGETKSVAETRRIIKIFTSRV